MVDVSSQDILKQFILHNINKYRTDINDTKDDIYTDFERELIKLCKKLHFKYNIKTFNYFENNIICNIMHLMGIKESSPLSLTCKKYNSLFKMTRFNNIVKIRFTDYLLINIFPNIKFRVCLCENCPSKIIKKLDNIYELRVSGFNNKFFPNINVKTLILKTKRLVKLSFTQNLVNLVLDRCNILDYSGLSNSNIINLHLIYCDIKNTKGLENIPNINITGCQYLTDISNLKNINKLQLHNCKTKNITSINNNAIVIIANPICISSYLEKYKKYIYTHTFKYLNGVGYQNKITIYYQNIILNEYSAKKIYSNLLRYTNMRFQYNINYSLVNDYF
jgi:hypothetical protein